MQLKFITLTPCPCSSLSLLKCTVAVLPSFLIYFQSQIEWKKCFNRKLLSQACHNRLFVLPSLSLLHCYLYFFRFSTNSHTLLFSSPDITSCAFHYDCKNASKHTSNATASFKKRTATIMLSTLWCKNGFSVFIFCFFAFPKEIV